MDNEEQEVGMREVEEIKVRQSGGGLGRAVWLVMAFIMVVLFVFTATTPIDEILCEGYLNIGRRVDGSPTMRQFAGMAKAVQNQGNGLNEMMNKHNALVGGIRGDVKNLDDKIGSTRVALGSRMATIEETLIELHGLEMWTQAKSNALERIASEPALEPKKVKPEDGNEDDNGE